MKRLSKSSDVWVFVEIKDHERILDGSLEILTKGRELANKLRERLIAVSFGLNIDNYIDEIKRYGPDLIICNEETEDPQILKHYNGEIFPDLWERLIRKYNPSIILFSATEAGGDLAARLAQRFSTGLTAHCSDLDIINSKQFGDRLLLMKRPAFSGNMNASILCPKTRPQMATVQQGVFEKFPLKQYKKQFEKETTGEKSKEIEIIKIPCEYELTKLKVINIEKPTRYCQPSCALEKASIIICGGRGMQNNKNFGKLYALAELLNAEVGATRVPVFKNWCDREIMIGQTGKVVKPDLYLNFGVSGQIQHISSVLSSKRIISVNIDQNAPINRISDYIVHEDSKLFLDRLIARLKIERKKYEN